MQSHCSSRATQHCPPADTPLLLCQNLWSSASINPLWHGGEESRSRGRLGKTWRTSSFLPSRKRTRKQIWKTELEVEEEGYENQMIYVRVHTREWEATIQPGNWFGFFIDYKLKFQAVINILSLNYTCCTELWTHLYKMSHEAVARHKFCGAQDFQHVAFCKDPPLVLNMATDMAMKCRSETSFPALFSCGPFSPPSPWFLNKAEQSYVKVGSRPLMFF